ncbi:MAG: SRPBCC domain-containing protein [Flavobacteriales bacterium TMED235]|nr:MAG: SRPBCC domain-containing protein [Flavobacteriales bacterium TMED235]|tara:strand:+ start:447 stop:881 length:435 start_codon:yes stop_codon:yes gene_type:complete
MSYTIHHLLHINAPIDKVFTALSSIEELKLWYTTEIQGSSKLNEIIEFKFGGVDFHSKVIELVPNEKIVMECVATSLPLVGQKVTYQLDQNDEKTRVRFSQDGFDELDDFYANMNFSASKYLESLRQYCQKGTSEAFGSSGYRS